jgi:exopolyphosphatase/pppGpp-phosphohydrolase
MAVKCIEYMDLIKSNNQVDEVNFRNLREYWKEEIKKIVEDL